MTVSIGHLHLVGRVVGSTRPTDGSDVVELLTGPAAREQVGEALTSAFGGEQVLVIRSLSCATTLRRDSRTAPPALAGSIAAATADLLREHPLDDDCVVRFPDEAAYVAAYIHDILDGHHDRWYYEALEPSFRPHGSPDWSALVTARRALRWKVLATVRRNGDLETLLGALGLDEVRELAGSLVDGRADAWTPLVTTAAEIVGRATGTAPLVDVPHTISALADAEPPPDWRDSASLGRAVAAAAEALLSAAGHVPGDRRDRLDRVLVAARQYEWLDPTAFADRLGARSDRDVVTSGSGPRVAPVLSPRVRRALADMASVVRDPRLTLDVNAPTSDANVVRLVAALVEAAPEWDDDELAGYVAAQALQHWEGIEHTAVLPLARRTGDHRTAALSPTPAEAGRGSSIPDHPRGGPAAEPAARSAPLPGSPPTSARALAELLDSHFPRPVSAALDTSPAAAGLLLLRAVLDLGLAPYLLKPVGDGEPLLVALLRRWTGAHLEGDDPLLGLVAPSAGEVTPTSQGLVDVCRLMVRRLLGQRLVAEPLGVVTTPHGADAIATVVVDASGRLLPWGTLGGAGALDRETLGSPLPVQPETGDATVRAGVAATLSAVLTVPGGPDGLLLDLVAASSVQAWARWLPGFADAGVPFLLETLVRRAAWLDVGPTDLTVRMSPRSHDVVLQLAGYLEPVQAGAELGGRRLSFMLEDAHGS